MLFLGLLRCPENGSLVQPFHCTRTNVIFRVIIIINHTMELWERKIKRRLQKDISITENQLGFMPGTLTIEAIYLLRRLMGLYRDRKIDLHMVFIDLKKIYDRILREVL